MKKLCVFLRFFLFCLPMSNTQPLALWFEHKWLAASLTDNSMLSHSLLHPENRIDVENRLKANQKHQIKKWNILEALEDIFVSTSQGWNVSTLSSKSAFPSESTWKLVIRSLYSHIKKESHPILDLVALTEDWTNID